MTFKGPMTAAAAGAALLLGLAAMPSWSQVGPVYASPKPDGLPAGTGAPFPKGKYSELNSLPDWGGVWTVSWARPGSGGPPPAPPPKPELKGKYLEAYQAWRKTVVDNKGVVAKSGSNCLPPGMPGIMTIPQYPYEFLFTPGRVTINQEAWMQTRHIWTDGRPHSDDPEPGFHGESIGHWEGDTLVADTIGIKDSVPLSMGMGHSDKIHVMERIHLVAGQPDTLVDEITVEDPEALVQPFHTTTTYKRDRYGVLLEFVCDENDRNQVDEHGNTTFQ